ncbi:uncharacterized protein in vnfD 5'region-like [Planococcus citri]|uniref:uncharacterized protein in vnfD 5'region-like n=1 Tax=Planococcus citri TaxID=170843 RepID=UPI0031F8CEBA
MNIVKLKLYFTLLACSWANTNCSETELKKLPWGQCFEKVLQDNIYVDKTGIIYELIKDGEKYYFFSHPRRFGKSLLVSTLFKIFSGNSHLFENLAIADPTYDYKFEKHVVLHFDFSSMATHKEGALETSIVFALLLEAKHLNITLLSTDTSERMADVMTDLFGEISKQYGKRKIVILVDEYNDAITQHMFKKNSTLAEKNLKTMTKFFTVLKSQNEHIAFCFVTGVANFAIKSMFSGQFTDISLHPKYATLVGFTKQELENNFKDHISHVANTKSAIEGKTYNATDILKIIGVMYDGYHFSEDTSEEKSVFNPISIVGYLEVMKSRPFWWETSTHSSVINLLKEYSENELLGLYVYNETKTVTRSGLSGSHELHYNNPTYLLVQTGYLTIQSYDKKLYEYNLRFPNKEVETCFFKLISQLLTGIIRAEDMWIDLIGIHRMLIQKDVDGFFKKIEIVLLQTIGSNVYPDTQTNFCYSVKWFHATLCSILKGMYSYMNMLDPEMKVTCEYNTAEGTAHIIIVHSNVVYVWELKAGEVNKIADTRAAMKQLLEKKYYQQFCTGEKDVVAVGIVFDSDSSNKTQTIAWESLLLNETNIAEWKTKNNIIPQ